MNDRTIKLLTDIKNAISLIEEFCVDVPDFSRYTTDPKTKSAVERQLSIIGEAVNKIMQINPDVKLSYARKIIDFRNRIIHSYDSIDDSIVWMIIRTQLPLLRIEVENALNNG